MDAADAGLLHPRCPSTWTLRGLTIVAIAIFRPTIREMRQSRKFPVFIPLPTAPDAGPTAPRQRLRLRLVPRARIRRIPTCVQGALLYATDGRLAKFVERMLLLRGRSATDDGSRPTYQLKLSILPSEFVY